MNYAKEIFLVLNKKGFSVHKPNKYRIICNWYFGIYMKNIIQFSMNCYWMKYLIPSPKDQKGYTNR